MNALVIRNAKESDIRAIIAIQNESATAAQWPESHYGKALNEPGRLILLAEQGRSQILGFLVASTSIKEWELENIAVSPKALRSGIGRALMNVLIARAREAGATEIRQEIRASNLAAQQLGLSVGFIQQGWRAGYYNNPVEDALLFKHLLGRS